MKPIKWLFVMAVIALSGVTAWAAGPYSDAVGGDGIDAGIPGYVGPAGDGVVSSKNDVNPVFVGWAATVQAYEPSDIKGVYADNGIGTQFTFPQNALYEATGNVMHIVSLGDMDSEEIAAYLAGSGSGPGYVTLGFDRAIINGDGADFAVFENGFISDYTTGAGTSTGGLFAELGYVEVSTDGINFARFPCSYLNYLDGGPTSQAYLTQDPTNIFNLAGKHVNGYNTSFGTPFDLNDLLQDELVLSGLVDLNEINYVRIVDIPGDGTFEDSAGNSIYDAWVTWGSGGVDLDAIGVINAKWEGDLDQDGSVGRSDAVLIRKAIGTSQGDAAYVEAADYDQDGDVDFADYRQWYKYYKTFLSET